MVTRNRSAYLKLGEVCCKFLFSFTSFCGKSMNHLDLSVESWSIIAVVCFGVTNFKANLLRTIRGEM